MPRKHPRLGEYWMRLKFNDSNTFRFDGEIMFASKALMDEFQGKLGKLFYNHKKWNPKAKEE